MDRDRDLTGRARNARPRDALGRPLPRGAAGVEPVPEQALTPADALRTAQELLDGGRAFAAHEVLEASWKAAPPAERELWRGLAQIAVGLTHAQRGNDRGARELVRRGAERIAAFASDPPYGLDVPGLLAWADTFEEPGAPGTTAPRLHREGTGTGDETVAGTT
jgi:hypothetical protein